MSNNCDICDGLMAGTLSEAAEAVRRTCEERNSPECRAMAGAKIAALFCPLCGAFLYHVSDDTGHLEGRADPDGCWKKDCSWKWPLTT